MKLLPFFTQRKPRKFEHKPIYYDPRKEALEERIQQLKREMGVHVPDQEYKSRIKGALVEKTRHVRRHASNPEKRDASRNIILAVILTVLIILVYYLYFKG